jgi:tRNA A37 methylthiotransferase MiaB
MPRVGFVSLGCPKNLVDSEVMLGLLNQDGHEITADGQDAEIIVVNTCGFIESAKQESIDTILGMAQESELFLEGRLPSQAPDIDGVVCLTDGITEEVRTGDIRSVRITEAHEYDLVGAVLS